MKYIDPTFDAGFKLMFGRVDVSEDLLKEFLNSIFEGDPELSDIRSIKYMNSEKQGEYSGHKGIRYDILCETGTGHRFIVEMQKASQPYFVKRAEYYYSRAVAEQGFRGKDEDSLIWDYNYMPVVGVYICQTNIKGLPNKLVTRCRLMDEATGKPIGSTIRYVYVQLPYTKETEEECKNYFEEWSYNITNMGKNQEVAFQSRREIFKRLARVANLSTLTPEEARIYEAEIKNARDHYNQLEGMRLEGIEEGAWINLCENVRSCRSNGLDNSTIAKFFNKSPELIASIP